MRYKVCFTKIQREMTLYLMEVSLNLKQRDKFQFVNGNIMSLNIAETFELLFDKNNSIAYKALQKIE